MKKITVNALKGLNNKIQLAAYCYRYMDIPTLIINVRAKPNLTSMYLAVKLFNDKSTTTLEGVDDS